ncbi:complement factor B-like [Python bivittatus]|uniref:Complement factor B-like n=1 Tax=Python bivittatus TaxID=176946 RepID=A0A9F2REC1_PYTBI|nr:complement factor B-like [Python bivittatus]
MNPNSSDAAWVIELMEKVKLTDHRQKPGTNINKGLQAVYEMMVSQEADERRRKLIPPPISNSTRHVIILMSDGDYNMGGDPISVIRDIKEFLRIGKSRSNPRNEYLGKS